MNHHVNSLWVENRKQNGGCPPELDGVEVVAQRRSGEILRGVANSVTLDYWNTSKPHDGMIIRYMTAIEYDSAHEKDTAEVVRSILAHDPVNKPSHYMLFPEQGIEFIDVRDVLIERLKDFSPKQIDYWSRAFEYLARAGGKNGVEDIKKAKWYLDRLVKTLEGKE